VGEFVNYFLYGGKIFVVEREGSGAMMQFRGD
jgi:hypothetical protein